MIIPCHAASGFFGKNALEFLKEMSNIFINAVKNIESGIHTADPSGKSYVNGIFFDYPSGDYAQVSCYDWSDEYSGNDHLRIGMISNEFFYWLQHGKN